MTWRSLEETRASLAATRRLTDRPFGVNVVPHWDPTERLALCLEAGEADTLRSTLFDRGWPNASARALRNSTLRRWDAAGRPVAGRRPGEDEVAARYPNGTPVTRDSDIIPGPGMTGDVEALALYAGESTGLIAEILPAGEIVRRIAAEALETLERLGRLVRPEP